MGVYTLVFKNSLLEKEVHESIIQTQCKCIIQVWALSTLSLDHYKLDMSSINVSIIDKGQSHDFRNAVYSYWSVLIQITWLDQVQTMGVICYCTMITSLWYECHASCPSIYTIWYYSIGEYFLVKLLTYSNQSRNKDWAWLKCYFK